ncbi:type VII secretion effector [Listeria grayi]|uniref:DUF3130 family protein n=1 Tax=Listeria grayi TaxID=1641 RepID=UPI000F6B6EF7|nr:DUF3130 family protein [Listeria grayi]VEI34843.1 type VII secretion effector [Listeria grayi]
MREIQVSEQKFQQHAARLGETSHAVRYRLKGNNLAYSRANSTNHLRTAIFDFISVVDDLQQLGQKDAQRLKKIGIAYAKHDQMTGQKIGQLEVR